MKKLLGVFLGIMVITALSACGNTFHGAGRDMENMGQWVQGKTDPAPAPQRTGAYQ